MTGLHLTPEAVQARRLELATVEEQIRALGRRKSVLRAEILSGYAAPAKGAPVEQLPLVETVTATTARDAPAQAPEAAKPATATATATPLRDRVRAALGAAKVRRSAKVLALLLGECEEDVADELEGLELAREVIGKETSDKAGRAYEPRERWAARRGKGRDAKPGKVEEKFAKSSALWRHSRRPGILLPSVTSAGRRKVIALLEDAPGHRLPKSEIVEKLGLHKDTSMPSGLYYQNGDWALKEAPAKPSKKPANKPPAKKAGGAAKGKKAEGTRSRTWTVAEDIETVLRDWGTWFDAGQLEAKVRELLPLSMGPSTAEWNNALRGLIEVKKIERREVDGRVQFRLAVAPEPKKKGKKAPEAPRPTVTVGEAMAKMLAEVSVHDWQQARAEVCERIAERKGEPVSVGPLLLKTSCDSDLVGPVLELLDQAGAVSLGRQGSRLAVVTPSVAVSDEEIDHDLQALTRRYVRDLVDDRHEPPTASELAESLGLPAALIDSVLVELRAAQELLCDREGRWSVRSPKASAAARTAPLFADVEPAPAVDGLEPEGDEP